MENASAALLDAVRCSMRGIRTAIGARTINPELLTCAERLRYQGFLRRQDAHAAIIALLRAGVPLKEIARRTGHSRNHVRRISRGAGADVFRTSQSALDGHLPFPDAQWSGGCHNGAELWRRPKEQGFKGPLRVVTEWATRRRRAETLTDRQLQKVPAARTIARPMTTKRDHLTEAAIVTVAAIENSAPMLADARTLIERFEAMIRKKAASGLEPQPEPGSSDVVDLRRSPTSSYVMTAVKVGNLTVSDLKSPTQLRTHNQKIATVAIAIARMKVCTEQPWRVATGRQSVTNSVRSVWIEEDADTASYLPAWTTCFAQLSC